MRSSSTWRPTPRSTAISATPRSPARWCAPRRSRPGRWRNEPAGGAARRSDVDRRHVLVRRARLRLPGGLDVEVEDLLLDREAVLAVLQAPAGDARERIAHPLRALGHVLVVDRGGVVVARPGAPDVV